MLAAHLGEDKVGGAVEDALDVVDLVGAQALVQRPDDGDAAADACLKQQLDPVFVGQLQQLGALLGDQLLVGGDDALAALQAALDKSVGRSSPPITSTTICTCGSLTIWSKSKQSLSCQGSSG